MKIRLDSARFEPFRWQERVVIPAEELDQLGLAAVAPVAVAGTLTFADPNYWLEMQLATQATVVCDRCLKPVEVPIEASVELMVERGADGRSGAGERELKHDDLGVVEVEGDSFESAPLVREQLVLELPAKPLCRADCAGLCPRCGADLNLGACGCGDAAVDPRWEALGALRDKLEGRA